MALLENTGKIPLSKTEVSSKKITTFEKALLDFCQEFGRPLRVDVIRNALPEGITEARVENFRDISRACGVSFKEINIGDFSNLDDSDFPILVQYKSPSVKYVTLMRRLDGNRFDVLEQQGLSERLPLEEQEYFLNATKAFSLSFLDAESNGGWAWILSPLKESKWAYGQVFLAALLINFLALSTSIFTMVVYDRVLPNNATESLVALTIGVSIALAFDVILKMLRGWFLDGAGSRADTLIGERLLEQLLALDLSAKRESVGALSSVMREFESLRDFMTSATLVALIDLPFIFIFLFTIYLLGGPVVIVPLILVPLVILVGITAQPFLSRLANESISQGKNKQSILVEVLSGIEVIKSSMAGREMRKRWRESLVSQSSSAVKSRAVSQFVINFSAFAQQLAQVGIVVVGAFSVATGSLTLGGLIASVILAGRTMAPLSQIANVLTRLVHAKASFRALNEFMALPLDRKLNARLLQKDSIDGNIEFRNVSFSYPGRNQMVLDEVSFSIRSGERVALLGKVGSGKSTAARLLFGLYEPTSGAVMVDGIDIRQIEPFDVKRNMSLVLQDSWLFSGSVRENILAGSTSFDDTDMLEASEIAGVSEFLSDHPEGYDLKVSEGGGGLSGGQKQSISIARGLVGSPSVVVMDEPTSMMDMASEARLVKRMQSFLENRTFIVITHRSAMLQLVDRVIVFDKGRIVLDGPKELLNKNKQKPE
ncbi:type I secretion system permease/ATPase [Rhodobacterales bacterium LSUCC1028]|nr:type I secretion system permease/ATPase [Rhodobacterales bacterium LSUCC1028]